jgi:hypothetical protein
MKTASELSCSDCKISKATPVLVAIFLAEYNINESDTFECSNCSNSDLWTIPEMLWNVDGEYLVTPCCHCEAVVALELNNYDLDNYDLDQHREDYENYVFAVTGR